MQSGDQVREPCGATAHLPWVYWQGTLIWQEANMAGQLYPEPSAELAHRRRELAPDMQAAFDAFGRQVFAPGALDPKTKQLIAVAVAHVTQCPYCIQGHTKAAQRAGATAQDLMEAVWVAAEMRAGGAYAHSALMLAAVEEEQQAKRPASPGG
jgi:AhpD family alkylhydroperoxidase